MRSKVLVTALSVMALMLAVAGSASAQAKFSDLVEAKSSLCYPLQLTFKRPGAVLKTAFPQVGFNHATHDAVACSTCHHTWDGKGQPQACNDSGCHDNYTERQDTMSYFKAFHAKDAEASCLGCHLKNNQVQKAKGGKTLALAPCSNNVCHVAKK